VKRKMNFLSFIFLDEVQAKNPFKQIETFLKTEVIDKLLGIVTPIATLAFIGLGIAAMLASDEHARAKLKSGMWWVGAAAALCFMAQSIVKWLEGAF
jgi:hypothetical protein